ncbi:MAG: hypothetical protein HY720_08800 [Planctomycetes bacterium]|nr:hypothetical protein [Planctomycetota bacterium]
MNSLSTQSNPLSGRLLARVLALDIRTTNSAFFGGGGVIWCNDVREGTGVAGTSEGYSSPEADT